MKSISNRSLLPFLLVPAALAGCRSSGDETLAPPASAAPTVAVLEPATDLQISPGEEVLVRYTDDDPDSAALTSLAAVETTSGVVLPIASGLPELDGTPQTFTWDTTGLPAGTWRVRATTSDESSSISAFAPAQVIAELVGELATGVRTVKGAAQHSPTAFDADESAGLAVIGSFFGEPLVFGEPGENQAFLAAGDSSSMFLARYAKDGELAFAVNSISLGVSGGGPEGEGGAAAQGLGVKLLPGGGVAALIAHYGPLLLGQGETNETILGSEQGGGLALARFGPTGELDWARQVVSTEFSFFLFEGAWLESLPGGDLAVVGQVNEEVSVIDPGGPNQTMLTYGADTLGTFLARYSAAGDLELATGLASGDPNFAYLELQSVAGNGSELLVSAWVGGDVVFQSGEPELVDCSDLGIDDLVLVRIDADGAVRAKATATANGDLIDAYRMALAPDGSFAVQGEIEDGFAVFAPGTASEVTLDAEGSFDEVVFLATFGPDGTLRYAYENPFGEDSEYVIPIALAPDGAVTAAFRIEWPGQAPVVLSAGNPGQQSIPYDPELDDVVVLMRFDSDGVLDRVLLEGAADDSLEANSVQALPSGKLLLGGRVFGQATFQSATVSPVLAGEVGSNSTFLAVYSPDWTF